MIFLKLLETNNEGAKIQARFTLIDADGYITDSDHGVAPYLKKPFRSRKRPGRGEMAQDPETGIDRHRGSPEESLPFVLHQKGEDILLEVSDFRHWDSIYPRSVKKIVERQVISGRQKRKFSRRTPTGSIP